MKWWRIPHYAGPAVMILAGVIAGGVMLLLAIAPGL